MNEQPHVETATGKVPEPVLQNNPGPHVETTSVPDATGNDSPVTVHDNPIPGTVLESLPPAAPFNAVEYFKSLSLPPQAQDALSKWQRDSEILQRLLRNQFANAILEVLDGMV